MRSVQIKEDDKGHKSDITVTLKSATVKKNFPLPETCSAFVSALHTWAKNILGKGAARSLRDSKQKLWETRHNFAHGTYQE